MNATSHSRPGRVALLLALPVAVVVTLGACAGQRDDGSEPQRTQEGRTDPRTVSPDEQPDLDVDPPVAGPGTSSPDDPGADPGPDGDRGEVPTHRTAPDQTTGPVGPTVRPRCEPDVGSDVTDGPRTGSDDPDDTPTPDPDQEDDEVPPPTTEPDEPELPEDTAPGRDRPPTLQLDGGDGSAPLTRSSGCWTDDGGDQRCADAFGIVAGPAVLTLSRGSTLAISGDLTGLDRIGGNIYRPEGEPEARGRSLAWPPDLPSAQRLADVPPGAITVDVAPGDYVLQLLLAFDRGEITYAVQLRVR